MNWFVAFRDGSDESEPSSALGSLRRVPGGVLDFAISGNVWFEVYLGNATSNATSVTLQLLAVCEWTLKLVKPLSGQ